MSIKKIGRREALGAMGAAAGAAITIGCGSGSPTSPADTSSSGTTTTGSTNAACAVTPSETAGPYPSLTDIFRSDIRDGKTGTLLALTIKVVNVNAACAVVPNANVEVWHRDSSGNYSARTQTTQTYLCGIQTTNSSGEVTFTTIYPGWYHGRATHIHVEVMQTACPEDHTDCVESINSTVHRSGVYASRDRIRHRTSPTASADSLSAEPVTPSGDPASGYAASCQGRDRCVDHTK
jgi:hypothetical protein